MTNAVREQIADALRVARRERAVTAEHIENTLGLARGWIETFESGRDAIPIELLLAILSTLGVDRAHFFNRIGESPSASRDIFAEQLGEKVRIHFRYTAYDAKYDLPNATKAEFDALLASFRTRLSRVQNSADAEQLKAVKTQAVAETFLEATRVWPHANPSDLWWFIIYRAFCDPYNHPADYARADFGQSWKRTGGWALEEVVVRHYRDVLKAAGIDIAIMSGERRRQILETFKLEGRHEADKIDVVLSGHTADGPRAFGVVHVKASFAERRTDDVPLSQSLIKAGYFSPLWTMDCKSSPAEYPKNQGELGAAIKSPTDRRSAKRKDIEDEGYFSNCFSYNLRTRPSIDETASGYRVINCNFADPDDAFAQTAIAHWKGFKRKHGL